MCIRDRMNINRLIEQIKKDEGFSPVAFWDRKQWTYGYGCKAPRKGATITEHEAEELLWDEIEEAIKDFETLYYDCRDHINDVRAEALINMTFNMGITVMRTFRKMNAAIELDDWKEASLQAKQSDWYYQVGNRAKRICRELLTGVKEAT